MQDCLQNVLSAVREMRMGQVWRRSSEDMAIARAAEQDTAEVIAVLRCGGGVVVRILRLRSEFR